MHVRHERKALCITAVPLLNRWFKGNSNNGTSGGCSSHILATRGSIIHMPDHNALRQAIRARRRAIPATTARQHAIELANNAHNHRLLLNSQHIASFLAADGEMDPLYLMHRLWLLGKKIYLPVLIPFDNNRLWFSRFEPGDSLVYNRHGILEPVRRQLIKPTALDLVLTPLVAFDAQGHRIGMGGGFYDRSFAFLQQRTHWKKPRLLGIAYELQQQPSIKTSHWDIPLDAIVTEKMFYATGK